MASRTTHHKNHIEPQPQKAQAIQPKISPKRLAIGKGYSLDEIQKLIEKLNGKDRLARISAVGQFAKDQSEITEAAAKLPEVSATQITESVIAAVMKDDERMIERFAKERETDALRFLAESSAVPEKVRERAAHALADLPDAAQKTVGAEKREAPEQHSPQEMYAPKDVELVVGSLGSRVKEIRVAAAVQFIKDYARITPTVAKMPLLTVTEVTSKAVEAIKAFPEEIISKMVERKMVEALEFLSSIKQVPLHIRNMAFKGRASLGTDEISRSAQTAVSKKSSRGLYEKGAAVQEAYDERRLGALITALESLEKSTSIKAAIEFLQKHDAITEAIAKAPMLTVTDVTKKAVGAVERNLDAILKELRARQDRTSLNLLAHSSKFSSKTRMKAATVLQMLLSLLGEGKEGK